MRLGVTLGCVGALVASVEGGALFTVRNLSGLQLNVQGLYRDTDDIFSYTLEQRKRSPSQTMKEPPYFRSHTIQTPQPH